jgi:hypothetical protein
VEVEQLSVRGHKFKSETIFKRNIFFAISYGANIIWCTESVHLFFLTARLISDYLLEMYLLIIN